MIGSEVLQNVKITKIPPVERTTNLIVVQSGNNTTIFIVITTFCDMTAPAWDLGYRIKPQGIQMIPRVRPVCRFMRLQRARRRVVCRG